MWLVWVLWKDVWNRSMGIKGLGSVGGLLCWRLSPLLASMISSIDRSSAPFPVCFLSTSFSLLHLPPSLALSLVSLPPFFSHRMWRVLLSPVWVKRLHTDAFHGCEWWRWQVTIAIVSTAAVSMHFRSPVRQIYYNTEMSLNAEFHSSTTTKCQCFWIYLTVQIYFYHPTLWSECCFKALYPLYMTVILVVNITVNPFYFIFYLFL